MAKRKSRQSTPDKLLASEVVSGSKGLKPSRAGKLHGEPNEIHIRWYREWSVKHRSIRSIALSEGVHHSTVHEAVHRVRNWARLELWDDIVMERERQADILCHIIEELFGEWERSKGIGVTEEFESIQVDGDDGIPQDATKTKRKEVHQCGDASYIAQIRGTLEDMRNIFGIEVNKKIDMTVDTSGPRLAGRPLEESKRIYAAQTIETLQRLLEQSE